MKRSIIAGVLAIAVGAGVGIPAYGLGQSHGYTEGTEDAQGVGQCPTEDSCYVDYVGDPAGRGRWVVRPSIDGE